MRPVERVLEHVDSYEEKPSGFWALCPAHDDHNPSLHVEEGEDGRALLVCRAGCDQADVLAALERRGLKRRDLFAGVGVSGGGVVSLNGRKGHTGMPKGTRSGRKNRRWLAKAYYVKDASGRLVAIHERWESENSKSFAWKHPEGRYSKGGEIQSTALPLYNSELVADWPKERAIVLVEGEQAADALTRRGIRALGTVCGAGMTPKSEVLNVLIGRRVILWADSDKEGRRHMERVAEALEGIATEVHWYEWRNAPEVRLANGKLKGQDAADHPAVKGGDRASLEALLRELREAPEWDPREDTTSEEPTSTHVRGTGEVFGGFNRTDMGNAERFVAQHGEDVRYCYPWGKWLVWSEARWERDNSGKVHRLAKETIRSIYREAAAAEDDDQRKALAQHATRSEAEARFKSMLELAKSEVPISPDELDANPWLLNAGNGTIDFRTGDLRPHRREDLLTKIVSCHYDPDAAAPTWDRFLKRVLPGEDLRAFVQRASGYTATGDTSEQCMFINHGAGNNGKSTFQEALAAALGDYAMRAPTEMLMARRPGSVPNDVARLKGARYVTASETEEGRRLAESLVKDLTGQDTITARYMKAEWFDFRPTHKLWLSTNHKPEIRGTDNAIWRRIRLIPWAVTVPPAEQERKLPEKLRSELPGILAWLVRGCLEWQRDGLRAPDEVREATQEYRAEMDLLAGFLDDCCVLDPSAWVRFGDLYAAYQQWCGESGVNPESKPRLGNRLKERGYEPDRGTGNVPIRRGIGLRNRDTRPPGEGSGVTWGNSSYPRVTPQKTRKEVESLEPSYSSYPELHMNTEKPASQALIATEGNSGNSGNSDASEKVEGLLADPPDWLRRQADKHLEDPTESTLRTLCAAVAHEALGNPRDAGQLQVVVEQWLRTSDRKGEQQ